MLSCCFCDRIQSRMLVNFKDVRTLVMWYVMASWKGGGNLIIVTQIAEVMNSMEVEPKQATPTPPPPPVETADAATSTSDVEYDK